MRITIKRKKTYQFIALLIVGIGVYLTIIHPSQLLTMVWLVVGGLYIIANTTDAAILMLVFLFPFEMWLPIEILAVMLFLTAILREKKVPKPAVIFAFLFIGLIGPWIMTTDKSIIIMIKSQIVLIIVFYTIFRGYQGTDPTKVCTAVRLSAVVYSVDILTVAWQYAGLYILEGRLGYGLSSRFPDLPKIPSENIIGFFMALAISSTLVEMYYTKKNRFITVLWLLLLGLMTKSMTFLIICLVIHILFYAFISLKGIERINLILLEGVIVPSGVFILYTLQPKFISRVLRRLAASDISNGRIEIFHHYNVSFVNGNILNILFGYGFQGVDALADGNSLHHLIQAWYIYYGVIGFLCIVLMIIYMVWRGYKTRVSRNSYIVSMIPLLVFLIEVQTGNPSSFWLLPGLLMLRLSSLSGRTKTGKLQSE